MARRDCGRSQVRWRDGGSATGLPETPKGCVRRSAVRRRCQRRHGTRQRERSESASTSAWAGPACPRNTHHTGAVAELLHPGESSFSSIATSSSDHVRRPSGTEVSAGRPSLPGAAAREHDRQRAEVVLVAVAERAAVEHQRMIEKRPVAVGDLSACRRSRRTSSCDRCSSCAKRSMLPRVEWCDRLWNGSRMPVSGNIPRSTRGRTSASRRASRPPAARSPAKSISS